MPLSKTDEHFTPDKIFRLIYDRWGYSKAEFFDPCPMNHTFDALSIKWKDLNFINMPYGIKKGKQPSLLELFVWKAHHETQWNGSVNILLCPAKVDQDWFHDYVVDPKFNYEIEWIRKRIKFNIKKCCMPECKNLRPALSSATQGHFLVKMEKS